MLIDIILQVGTFANIGCEVEDSFNYYYTSLYKKAEVLPITNYDISHNKIMNYFWGICYANRLEIKERRVKYDRPTKYPNK